MKFLIVLLNFSLFFSYLLNNSVISLIMILILIYAFFSKEYSIKLYKQDLYLIVLNTIFIFSFLISQNKSFSLMYLLLFVASSLVVFAIRNNKKWIDTFYKSALMFSFIHVCFTVLQFLIPDLVMKINSIILRPGLYWANWYLLQNGSYAGITGQTGANAFYISIFIILMFCNVINNKINLRNIIALLLGLFSLFLTNKFGLLLSIIISLIVIVYIFTYNKTKYKKKIVAIKNTLFSIGIIVFVLYFFVINNLVFSLDFVNEITSGRIDIYKGMFALIKNHIFIGNGLLYVPFVFGIYGHNIYLQLLSEVGLLGLLLFSALFIKIIYQSIKNCKYFKNNKKMLYYSLTSLGFFVFFIVYGFSGNPIYDGFSLMFFMIFLAICENCQLERGRL